MARNLGFGTKLIRVLLLCGAAISIIVFVITKEELAIARFYSLMNCIIFLIIFGVLSARKLPVRVKMLSSVMDQAADGDLSVRGHDVSSDEVGLLNSNFNEMLERLGQIVNSIRNALNELRIIGTNVNDVAAQCSSLAERQKGTADRTKSAARQIRVAVEEVNSSVAGLSDSAGANAASIQQMVSSTMQINLLVEELLRSVELVSDSIVRMAGGQNEINANVQHLLENAQYTTNIVAEMEHSVGQIEEASQEAARISTDVLHDAEQGNSTVKSTITGIRQIRTASQTVQEAIGNLSLHAANIGSVLLMIDEVTEQTKLLALNASIIAAQAGDHGKGFGVVANEIKELARRTTSSTREIAEIVNGVKYETDKAVQAITVTEQAVSEGEQLSYRSGEALYKIVNGVKRATEQARLIATVAEQHTEQGGRVRSAMEQMGAMVEEIVRASDLLTRDAEVINQASGDMCQLATNVHVNSRSHNDAGTTISSSTETIVQMVGEIRNACLVQLKASEQVVHTAEELEGASDGNLQATRSMEDAVNGLSHQISALEKEMAGFKTLG